MHVVAECIFPRKQRLDGLCTSSLSIAARRRNTINSTQNCVDGHSVDNTAPTKLKSYDVQCRKDCAADATTP
jgi:hypothetical protein